MAGEHHQACSERGSGSVLAVALVAAVLLLTGLALPLNAALTTRQLTANAADAAALAAADTASGLVPGSPCTNAARAARLNGADLGECSVDGVEVRVTASRTVLGVVVTMAARAGPPQNEGSG
ncbi:secretion/DNA translocation related TadE-like protein [Mycetocola sp. CAN_C7]|uniref:Rv3654c family TadE-like protein n=1 Tax=Mycetocola sp. CAN_C7 TaxID=2787724 RepID=UPI0018C9D516